MGEKGNDDDGGRGGGDEKYRERGEEGEGDRNE